MQVTYNLAMAAGRDAGNRHMKAHGRTSWNEDDYAVAAATAERLADLGRVPTTCIEHAYGTTTRLSFQIKVF